MNVKLVKSYYRTTDSVDGDLEIEDVLVFEDAKGEVLEIGLGYWSRDVYNGSYDIEDVVEFASFIDEGNILDLSDIRENFDIIFSEYQKHLKENGIRCL